MKGEGKEMAYDPEARQQSNSAMIIGIVALVLLVVGALAYFSTRNTQAETASTTVVTPPAETRVIERTEVVPVPANPAPPVVVERQVPVPVTPPTRVIERDTRTTVTRDRVVPAPSGGASGTPRTSTNTNVTVNVPAAPSRVTSQPQAGSDAGTGAGTDAGAGTDTGTGAGTGTDTTGTP